MATDTLKAVYFPEIPPTEVLNNGSDLNYLDGKNLTRGSVDWEKLAMSRIGGENTLWGFEALYDIIPLGTSGADLNEGRRNTAIGYQALTNLTYGHDNVAIGYRALYSLVT